METLRQGPEEPLEIKSTLAAMENVRGASEQGRNRTDPQELWNNFQRYKRVRVIPEGEEKTREEIDEVLMAKSFSKLNTEWNIMKNH